MPSKKVRVVPEQKNVNRWSMPFGIRTCGHHARGENRLDLRSPEEPAVDLGVIERADPDAVAPRIRVRLFRSQSETANCPRALSNIASPRSS